MMNKKQISQYLDCIKKNKKLLNKAFSVSLRKIVDETDTKVWGVIGTEPQKHLSEKPKSLKIKHEIKKNQIKAIKIISNIYGKTQLGKNKRKNINTLIIEKMYSTGQALELFILDALDRGGKNNIEITAEQLDEKGIDFITEYEKVKFGIQLTYRKNDPKKIKSKKEKIYNLGVSLDNPNKINPNTNKNLEKDKFSQKQIPDLPVFMTINSKGTQKIYESINSKGNILQKAYKERSDKGYSKGGPSEILPKILKDDLNFISENYNLVIDNFLSFIKNIGNSKNNNLNKRYKKDIQISENIEIKTSYNPKTYIYSTIIKKEENMIFSLDFYITQKFLKKIGSTEKINKSFI